MRPLFTVGIPVYNAMPYLPDAVQSVLHQRYPHFELLIINDGSQDRSVEYLYDLKDARIRIISQENRGLTATLNRMLEEARTPWLVRLDADDVASPERLAMVASAIERHPAAGMFYSRASHLGHPQQIAAARSTEGSAAELCQLTRAGYLLSIVHSSVVLNVVKARALGGYRFDLHIEDVDLWWRMALRHQIVFIPQVTVRYRLNSGSICSNNLRRLSENTLFAQYLLLSHLWRRKPLAYEAVVGALSTLLDEKRLAYRKQMWLAAAYVGARRYCRALPHLVQAAVRSPGHFIQRISYPFTRASMVLIGEDPRRFRCIEQRLWETPQISNSGTDIQAMRSVWF